MADIDDDGPAWRMAPHVCRVCFGRVLATEAGAGWERGSRLYRCSNCGIEAIGRAAAAICACGMKLRGGQDAGIRCELNTEPTPEFPSEVVAVPIAQ